MRLLLLVLPFVDTRNRGRLVLDVGVRLPRALAPPASLLRGFLGVGISPGRFALIQGEDVKATMLFVHNSIKKTYKT